jgi:hypothetical protein
VRLQNSASHVVQPLPALALVAAPSAASKFAPSTTLAVKAEPAEADQSSVSKRKCNVLTKYRPGHQPNIMLPLHVAFTKFAFRLLHQQQKTQQQLIDAWNTTHAHRWKKILQHTVFHQTSRCGSCKANNFLLA